MTKTIKFGTDGWRGMIAEDYTFDNVRRVAQAVAEYFRDEAGAAERGVIVGYDRRFGSEHFAAATAEVLAGNGIHVFLTPDATPTPVISYAVLAQQAAGAVNITASHNPPTDNGFKVRDHWGAAVAPDGLKRIEARIPDAVKDVRRLSLEAAKAQGLVETFDPAPAYFEYVKRHLDLEPIRQAGLSIVYDAMWGNGAGWFDRLLDGGSTTLHTIHGDRNPIFPEMRRPEPIPPNIDVLLKTVVDRGADAGIATDGDADRVGFADEKGSFVDQLRVFGLLAMYVLRVRGQRGPIVKTLSTTSMLNKLGRQFGVDVHETGVGFKYVGPKMVETDAMLGGEESGGFAFRGLPERDGILVNLALLDLMVQMDKRPSELVETLFEMVGPHFYDRVDVRFPTEDRPVVRKRLEEARPGELAGVKVHDINTTDGFKYELGDDGWLLIRFSGTEPLIRVYTETTHQDSVQALLRAGLALAGLEPPEN
ncbi:MAG: phosphoglucomutase/phosphomannomutase family protein [Anaerolineae bacterium]